MKKKWTWIILWTSLVMVFMVGIVQKTPIERVVYQFERDQAKLEKLARLAVAQRNLEGVEAPDGWTEVSLYNAGNDWITVEFQYGSFGIAPSGTYWGVNYVPSDQMLGFQGVQGEYWKQVDDGRLYYEPESDNTCYVQRLAPCWYLYEAKF